MDGRLVLRESDGGISGMRGVVGGVENVSLSGESMRPRTSYVRMQRWGGSGLCDLRFIAMLRVVQRVPSARYVVQTTAEMLVVEVQIMTAPPRRPLADWWSKFVVIDIEGALVSVSKRMLTG